MSTKHQLGYKITNWRKYNESLVNRGDITIWFSEDAVKSWEHPNRSTKVGRPFTYSETAIECLLTIRELFQLPYRQTEGFGRSLAGLLGVAIAIPDFTSLAKRAAQLQVALRVFGKRGPLAIVIDSTGLKVFGEGEWKMRTYGKSKRRTWRKVHLTVDPDTHEIVAEVLTENSGHDADQVQPLLAQVQEPIATCYGDGSYDKWKVYEVLESRGIDPVIPPQYNAKIKQHGNSNQEPLPRDAAIRAIRRLGRRGWKQEVSYHRRSLGETAIFRFKHTFGDQLKNRKLAAPQTESRIRCKILNQFSKIGMPQFEWS